MVVKVRVERTNDLSNIARLFDELVPNIQERALNRALGRTMTGAVAQGTRLVRTNYRIQAGDMKNSSFTKTVKKGVGELVLKGTRFGLGYFNPAKQGKNNVRVAITQSVATRVALDSNGRFQPIAGASGKPKMTKRRNRQILKNSFILPKEKLRSTKYMRPQEKTAVFARYANNKKIKKTFTISTAEMFGSGNILDSMDNYLANDMSKRFETELRGFVAAIAAGRVKNR